MDFFREQTQARQRTGILLSLYALAIAGITAALYGLALLVECYLLYGQGCSKRPAYPDYGGFQDLSHFPLWQPELLFWTAAGVILIVLTGTLYKMIALGQGGSAVLRSLGGVQIQPNTAHPSEKKVLNVVEEVAIASGTAVPPVFVLRGEHGINALAAGFSTRDAAIGVTEGAIELLKRDELQGVIAHEFSHILNGDMRLNLRLMGILHGIVIISLAGQMLLRSRVRGRGAAFVYLLGFGLFVIGSAGAFCARLIKYAVSRQREHLADASAVQFTRYPQGLAGALKKIGGLSYGSRVQRPGAGEVSHFFFCSAVAGLFSTHPPLAQRIKKLDPLFDGKFPKIDLASVQAAGATAATSETVAAAAPAACPPAATETPQAVEAKLEQIAARAGAPKPEHLCYAASLLAAIPARLKEAAQDPYDAQAMIYGLLVQSTDHREARQKQAECLRDQGLEPLWHQAARFSEIFRSLGPDARLPLIDLALPSLRLLSKTQYEAFRKNIASFAVADSRVDFFEFALIQVVRHHLDRAFRMSQPRLRGRENSRENLAEPGLEVLSLLAHAGNPDDSQKASAAFRAGAEVWTPGSSASIVALESLSFGAVSENLELLAESTPALRQSLLKACVAAVQHDGVIHAREREILRAFADSLDCPLPPFAD